MNSLTNSSLQINRWTQQTPWDQNQEAAKILWTGNTSEYPKQGKSHWQRSWCCHLFPEERILLPFSTTVLRQKILLNSTTSVLLENRHGVSGSRTWQQEQALTKMKTVYLTCFLNFYDQHLWHLVTQSYLKDAFVGPLKTQMSVSTVWFRCIAPSISIMELKLRILLLPRQCAISTEEQIVGMISSTNFPFLVGHKQPMSSG